MSGTVIIPIENVTVEKVKRATLVKQYNQGGLKMIDMHTVQLIIVIKWIARITSEGDAIWKSIPLYHINKLGPNNILFKMNTNYSTFKGIKSEFPRFYNTMIKMWLNLRDSELSVMTENTFSEHAHVIWNNKLIKYRGNVIFNHRLINKGIIFLTDVIRNKSLISYDEFVNITGRCATSVLDYNVIKNAIPRNIIGCNIHPSRDFEILFGNVKLCDVTTTSIKHTLAQLSEQTPSAANDVTADVWSLPFMVTRETNLTVLQWKILHKIYPCNTILKKMKIKHTNQCEHCDNSDVDTLEHFFFYCNKISCIWKYLEDELNIRLQKEQVMYGIPRKSFSSESEFKNVNLLILIAKKCISKYKYDTSRPLLLVFRHERLWREM